MVETRHEMRWKRQLQLVVCVWHPFFFLSSETAKRHRKPFDKFHEQSNKNINVSFMCNGQMWKEMYFIVTRRVVLFFVWRKPRRMAKEMTRRDKKQAEEKSVQRTPMIIVHTEREAKVRFHMELGDTKAIKKRPNATVVQSLSICVRSQTIHFLLCAVSLVCWKDTCSYGVWTPYLQCTLEPCSVYLRCYGFAASQQ